MLTIYNLSLNCRLRSKRDCLLSLFLLVSDTSVWNNNNVYLLKLLELKQLHFVL